MLNRAVALQPLNPAVHNNLARLYMMQGKKTEAIANLEATIEKMPDSGAAYLTLALIHQRDKDYGQAIAVYRRALEHNPDFWFAANNLAFLLGESATDAADLEQAMELANRALLQRPEDPSALDTVGWLHYRMGEYNQALPLIEQAQVRAPETAIISSHLGMVLYKMGRIGEARENLQKALSGDEDFMGREDAEQVLRNLSS
jgi:tetratricopeptide (TPR) repeat protein